jgi:putative FmdB family regulatory protein
MPTYDYVCEACGHEFGLFQQMSAPVETNCPSCSKESLRRLVGTGGGIIFKGSGFYETDYRSAAYKKAADSEQKSEGGGKKEAKSDPSGDASPGTGSSSTSSDSPSAKGGSKGDSKGSADSAPASSDGSGSD